MLINSLLQYLFTFYTPESRVCKCKTTRTHLSTVVIKLN